MSDNPETLEANTVRKMEEVGELSITFDDGVELDIKDATPVMVADFLAYQGIDLSVDSSDAPRVIDWFKARGYRNMSLTVDNRIRKWNPWWFVCRYRVWRLESQYL